MIHLELAKQLLDMDAMELAMMLKEIERSRPEVIEGLKEHIEFKI